MSELSDRLQDFDESRIKRCAVQVSEQQVPPGWRVSTRYRWAWLEGNRDIGYRSIHKFTGEDVWEFPGMEGRWSESELNDAFPDFAWGPWALEPDASP